MKTSNEVKAFLIEKLEARDPMALYIEFFDEIEENPDVLHIKSVISRWRCACREVSKEKNWPGIDETFPQSIFCWNATINAIDNKKGDKFYQSVKSYLGFDIKAIADGKHCPIAQIIINALQEAFIKKEKKRLGLED